MFGPGEDAFDVFTAPAAKRPLAEGNEPPPEESPAKRLKPSAPPAAAEPAPAPAAGESDPAGGGRPSTPTFKKNEGSDNSELFTCYQRQHVDDFSVEGCVHKILYPPLTDIEKAREIRSRPIIIQEPAKEYPFKLDTFQSRAVECVERKENVLVAAHTSAGKTTIAEYAVAKSLKQQSRVIYTSPIKALSNQKYRDLQEEFEDVGLMTGDVTINPTAGCLVMTTEILRNMLYRGSEVIREIAWVIFDEVHYMRDKERGVVWEESLILLPKNTRFVFLSATLPNCRDFAAWIAKLNGHPCNVIYTEFRPVPLQHYIFPAGGNGIHLVVDEKRKFRSDNFERALTELASDAPVKFGKKGRAKVGGKNTGQDVFKIVKMIMQRKYDPVIVFCFSRKDCEAYAMKLMKLDFCEEAEKSMIMRVFQNAIDSLNEDDRKLPQVNAILSLLKRGIGIHHSGLLPILKEVIEILFGEGLLKCLFATETFAMGLNMPAKTVVFAQVKKWDGQQHRLLSSGEYVQMSGRAGRRGKDKRGICIMMVDKKIEAPQAKTMLRGVADPLLSSFHLGYNMLLNLMRQEDAHPQYLIERSLLQFQSTLKSPELTIKIEETKAKIKELNIPKGEGEVQEYYGLKGELARISRDFLKIRNKPKYLITFINPGRIVKVVEMTQGRDWGWGIITSMKPITQDHLQRVKEETGNRLSVGEYIVYVLLKIKKRKKQETQCVPFGEAMRQWQEDGEKGPKPDSTWMVMPCQTDAMERISKLRVNFLPKNLNDRHERRNAGARLEKVFRDRKYDQGDGPPDLDPVKNMNIEEKGFKTLRRTMRETRERLEAHPLHNAEDDRFSNYTHKLDLESKLQLLEAKKGDLDTRIGLSDRLKSMNRVLRRLGLATSDGVVTQKGRVAAELTTGDELVGAELIYSGHINDLDPAQLAALASCLVFCDNKNEETIRLRDKLGEPYRQLKICARRVAEAQTDAKIELDVDEFIKRFNPGMMDITYAWAKGAKFHEIMKMTSIFEGSVIRVMRRLEEMLSELLNAVSVIGNEALKKKFAQSKELIKRDIVFSASLYL